MSARKFPPPAPTLHQRLIQAETQRHAGRMKEIAAAAKKLEMLQPTFEALEARGIRIWLENVRVNHQGALALSRGLTCGCDNALHQALLELGFSEVSSSAAGPYLHVLLKKGRLQVALMIDAPKAVPSGGAA